MENFTEQAIKVMKNIPPGKVMTYGQVAEEAGKPRGARQVARILHSMSRVHNIPWHRIVNAKGEIALRDGEGRKTQLEMLEKEGVVPTGGRIDLKRFRHDPGEGADTVQTW